MYRCHRDVQPYDPQGAASIARRDVQDTQVLTPSMTSEQFALRQYENWLKPIQNLDTAYQTANEPIKNLHVFLFPVICTERNLSPTPDAKRAPDLRDGGCILYVCILAQVISFVLS